MIEAFNWKQDSPKNQFTVILAAIEGELSNVEDNTTPSMCFYERTKDYIQQLVILRPYANDDNWDNLKPRFDHDCSACVYLGRYKGRKFAAWLKDFDGNPAPDDDDHESDLYVCMYTPNKTGSVIARYSSEGSDYASSMFSVEERLSRFGYLALAEAWRRYVLMRNLENG